MAAHALKDRALRLLAQREHSRAELARKLGPHGTPDEIDATLERMIETGLQSDRRFAEAWVRSKSSRFGTARLRHDLVERGVDRELIEDALAEACAGDDVARARRVWRVKFGTAPDDRRDWARQARFLQGRGFSATVIAKVLKESPDESAQG